MNIIRPKVEPCADPEVLNLQEISVDEALRICATLLEDVINTFRDQCHTRFCKNLQGGENYICPERCHKDDFQLLPCKWFLSDKTAILWEMAEYLMVCYNWIERALFYCKPNSSRSKELEEGTLRYAISEIKSISSKVRMLNKILNRHNEKFLIDHRYIGIHAVSKAEEKISYLLKQSETDTGIFEGIEREP